jgi:hypothetical protein
MRVGPPGLLHAGGWLASLLFAWVTLEFFSGLLRSWIRSRVDTDEELAGHAVTIPSAGRFRHAPRVKSGKSTDALRRAMERSLNSDTADQAAPS